MLIRVWRAINTFQCQSFFLLISSSGYKSSQCNRVFPYYKSLAMLAFLYCFNFENSTEILFTDLNFNLKHYDKWKSAVKLIPLVTTSNLFPFGVVQNATTVNFVYHGKTRMATTTFYHWSYGLLPLETFHLLPWNSNCPGIRLTPPIVGIETSVILSLPECSIAIPCWCTVIPASPCCLLFIVGSFPVSLFIKIGGCRRFGETFWLFYDN